MADSESVWSVPRSIGVLGGMGPSSTLVFCNKLLKLTSAATDQQHYPQLILNNTDIPDRTECILSGETAVVKRMLVGNARFLERSGACLVASPCNTAHYWAEDIVEALSIPFVDMIDSVLSDITFTNGSGKVGLLSTRGVVNGEVYDRYAKSAGISLVKLAEPEQEVVSGVIDRVKASRHDATDCKQVEHIIEGLMQAGVDSVILGCTELPLAYPQYTRHRAVFDPMDSLAAAVIRRMNSLACKQDPVLRTASVQHSRDV